MLVSVALALKNICDLYDCFLARDEGCGFVIIIKGGDQSSVLEVADCLCKAVKESRTEHKYSKISHIITLSVGVSAVYPRTIAILKSKVNNALQNAKILGGNKISNDNKESVQKVSCEIASQKRNMSAPELNKSAPNMDKVDFFVSTIG